MALYHCVHGKSLSTVSSFEHWARKMFLLHLLRQVHCHLTQQKNRRDVFAENQAFSILHQAQEGRQELIKQDVGEMLVSIVLDRPLDEAKALVEDRDRLISEITVILESQQANMLNQMVNPDVRDDMLHRSLIEKIRPPKVPHKQKHHKLGSSSVIVADVTNVGDPRLVIPVHMAHASFLVVKKRGPTWETHDWPVVPCNASYALDGFPLPPSPLLCFWFVGGGGLFFSVFCGSRL